MPNYKKGLETKENIINAARKLFYIHGFKKVSAHQICQESHVKLGTLTYYFKKKDDLVNYFYNDYIERIKQFVEDNTQQLNPAQIHIYMILFYYFNIYRDYNTVCFHEEVLSKKSMNSVLHHQKQLIAPFAVHSQLAKDDEMFDLLVSADNAVRRELNLMNLSMKTKNLEEIKTLVTKIYTVTAQLFSFDQELLKKYIDEGYDFLLENVQYHIHLLL